MASVRGMEEEARSPKYAHVERERRCLIDVAALPPRVDTGVLIEDRYLEGGRLRLRRMTIGQRAVLKLTKKYDTADPLARAIVTAYLTETEYALLATLPARVLTKRRHALLADTLTYSLDLFEGALAGLALAEIEWGDDPGLRALPAPPGTIREVTEDPLYAGGALVLNGVPEEKSWPTS